MIQLSFSLDDWDMRSDRNFKIVNATPKQSLDDWDMRSDRNMNWLQEHGALSLDDWDMRSDRNRPKLERSQTKSLDDWDMRSDRNLLERLWQMDISLDDWDMRSDRNVGLAVDSPEGERQDVLGTLVQAYEARHHPIDPPGPIEAIKFRMEQSNLTVNDVVPYFGPLNRVYGVLSHKRCLSLNMIRRLSDGLHIPAEVLIRETQRVAV